MKQIKRTLAFLLCAVMILGLMPAISFAAEGATNVVMTVDKTEVQPGDTITVTLNHKEMTVSSFTCGVSFDTEMLECVSIVGQDPEYPEDFFLTKTSGRNPYVNATSVSTVAEANGNGNVGFALAASADATYIEETIYVVTFTVKEGASGTLTLTAYEDSAGTDACKNDAVQTENVTVASSETTVNCFIADYADANGWENSKQYPTIIMDDVVTVTATGGGNTGKYYTSGEQWRIYQTENPTVEISAAEGYTILSVTITYASDKKGVLTYNGTNISSGTAVEVNAASITFGVGNTGTATNGQVRITDIEVTYVGGSGSGGEGGETPTECTHENATHFAANPSTCQAKGNIEYWYCADCDKYFSDAAYTTEIAKADTELPLGDHAYTEIREGTWKCDCGWFKEESILTIEEANAFAQLAGSAYSTGKYYVTGTIVEIKNTTYGNVYIEDADGNQLYVYGLYIDEGNTRYDAMDPQPIVGDTITVYGVLGTHNGSSQMKHAWVTEHTTPECTHENAEFQEGTPSTCSVAGTIDHWYCPDCDRNFADEACTEVLTDISAPLDEHDYNNPEDARRCVHCGYYKPDSTLTILEANEFGNDFFTQNTFSEGKYFVTGTVVEIKSTTYGNVYIEDAQGNRFYIYGIVDENGTRFDQAGIELGVGDVITVYGIIGNYNGAQMKSAVITQRTPAHTCGAEGTLTETEQKNADCGHAGHKAYWTCSCGKVYADAAATTEIPNLAAWLAEGGEGYIPATGEHNYIPGEYIWSEDYSTCTVVGTCGCGATATATAYSTFNVTTVGTCQTAEVVTYTADFAETWAEDQSKDVTGEKDMDNHVGELAHEYVDYYEHKTYYTCCPDLYEVGDHFDDNGECDCGAIGVRVDFYGVYFEGADPSFGDSMGVEIFFVLKDQDLRLKVYPGGTWPYVGYSICDYALDDPWSSQESVMNTTELVVSHEWYDAEELFILVQAYSIQTIDLNGGSLTDEAMEEWGADYDAEKNVLTWLGAYESSWTMSWYAEDFVREGYVLTGFMDGGQFCELDSWIESTPENRTLTLVWKCENDHANTSCTVDEDGTHTITCDSCGEVIETFEGHRYDDVDHKCVCDHVEEFTLTLRYLDADGNSAEMTIQVPFGTLLSELDEVLALPSELTVQNTNKADAGYFFYTYDGVFTHCGWAGGPDGNLTVLPDEEYAALTMPAYAYTLDFEYWFTGWEYWYNVGWVYTIDHNYMDGWIEVENNWYYFEYDESYYTSFRVEGLSRVPYPAFTINGITYGPNQDALDYCQQEGTTFIDETEAWFLFGEDGKLLNTFTGVEDGHYYENGMQTWHPGAVEGMYFIGDVVNGGNIPANGDTYIIYANESDLIEGAIYHFVDGVLSGREGIVDGKYYEGSRLMIGNGLTKVGENYIYVRSNGYIVVNSEYYVGENDLGIATGMYYFDENGFMVAPVTTDKDGVYYENGAYYYYQDGKIAYGLGLIQISANWYDGEGGYLENVVVYVRNNGQLATGYYYVSNLSNYTGTDVKVGDKVLFSFQGTMIESNNGIVGNYYYENNSIVYGAGLIEYNGGYIYVRSDGTVVKGTSYWITNTNGLLDQGCYEFDEDGMIVIPETYGQTGIIDGYYYVDGKIAYGMGLLEIEEGVFIYVRSNGQLATGEYYITNLSNYEGTDFQVGDKLIFGEDGKLTAN